MSENNDIKNEITDPEASARAEKIRAIKEAMRRRAEAEENAAPEPEYHGAHEAEPEYHGAHEAEPEYHGAHEAEPEYHGAHEAEPEYHGTHEAEPEYHGAHEAEPEYHGAHEAEPEYHGAHEAEPAPEPKPEKPKPVSAKDIPIPESHRKKSGKKKKKKKKKSLGKRIRGIFPEKGDSVGEIIRKIIFIVAIIAVIVFGYRVGSYYFDLWRNERRNAQIADMYEVYKPIRNEYPDDPDVIPEEKYYELLTGAQKLLDINPEIVGFMEIPTIDGDPIVKIPVVQASNNEKYLNRSFDLKISRAGALFLDWRNHFDHVVDHRLVDLNSENLVVYGHNMADDSMFGTFKYYHKVDGYYSKHPIIYFDSNYETYTYKIFSVFILDAEDESETKFDCWNRLDFNDEEEFYWFVNEAKRRTIHTNDVDVKYGDQLLTLSTCNTYLGDRGRLILMARRVRPGEDPYEGTQNSQRNKNIKWPSMYYNTVKNEKYDPDDFVPYGPDKDKGDDKKKD